jgi:hypothetical protein
MRAVALDTIGSSENFGVSITMPQVTQVLREYTVSVSWLPRRLIALKGFPHFGQRNNINPKPETTLRTKFASTKGTIHGGSSSRPRKGMSPSQARRLQIASRRHTRSLRHARRYGSGGTGGFGAATR